MGPISLLLDITGCLILEKGARGKSGGPWGPGGAHGAPWAHGGAHGIPGWVPIVRFGGVMDSPVYLTPGECTRAWSDHQLRSHLTDGPAGSSLPNWPSKVGTRRASRVSSVMNPFMPKGCKVFTQQVRCWEPTATVMQLLL